MKRIILCLMLIGSLGAQQVVRNIRHTTIVPDQFLRSYDPITVFFEKTTGPEEPGPLDEPGDRFSITPLHPGVWSWIDSKTLQFTPTIAWPALREFKIEVPGSTRKLQTFMAAPSSMTPSPGSRDLDPFTEITFSLRYPVKTEVLAEMLQIEVRNLPGLNLKNRYWLTKKDFTIKALERKKQSELPRYQLTLSRPIPFGKAAFLHARLCLDHHISSSVITYQWQTRSSFQLLSAGAGSSKVALPQNGSQYPETQALECPGAEEQAEQDRFFLEFSNDVGDVNLVDIKKMVRFEPAVQNFDYRISHRRIYFQFSAKRSTTYRMLIQYAAIKDTLGRELDQFKVSSLYFFLPMRPGYLKWQAGLGILERFGPQEFAMEGLGGSQLDLRIYRIDPLDRNFWPFPEEGLTLNEESVPAGPGEEPNYARDMNEHIRQMEAPLFSRIISLPAAVASRGKEGRTRFGLNLEPFFREISGEHNPGTYLVGMRELGKSNLRHYVRVQVTDLCLTTVEEERAVLFAVTSLKTGKPMDGAQIRVEYEIRDKGKAQGRFRTLASGTTDEFGFFRYEHKHAAERPPSRIIVKKGSDSLVLDPDLAPPVFMDNHWYSNWNSWMSWWKKNPNKRKERDKLLAHLFVERPVYKPEEPVHIKGYCRIKTNGKLTTPKPVTGDRIVIEGPDDSEWIYPVKLNKFGSFDYTFKEDDLPTGQFSAYFVRGGLETRLGYVSFKKEAYRIPRFEVRLHSPSRVPNDRPFQIKLDASFYAGGKVADSELEWQVTEKPYVFQPASYPGFIFSTNERYGNGPGQGDETRYVNQRTDADGTAELTVNPQDRRDGQPRRYTVEATLSGADEQTVSSTRHIIAMPSFVLGVKLDRYISDSKIIRPNILVLDHSGKPFSGQAVHLRLLQRQWHSYLRESDFTSGKAKYVTDVVDIPLMEKDLESQNKAFSIDLPVEEAGVYLIELTGRDRLGRAQKVMADLFVAGDQAVSWEKPKQMVFETVWDQKTYEPGDRAELLLKSPFMQGQALVVVEGNLKNSYQWVKVKNGTARFSILVDGLMAPQIPIHILLSRGRTGKISSRSSSSSLAMNIKRDLSKPMSMGSTAWLKVKPETYRANLKLKHPVKVLPGQEIDVEISMNRADGLPLDGEVTLWLVDRAVLALGNEADLDPVPSFLTEHEAWVRLRDTRNRTIGHIPLEAFPGGGGDGMSGDDLFGRETVRRNFKTVPYYNPTIVVSSGKAVVHIKCPDNLTDFAVRAVATDGNMRFGWAKSKLSVRLPLIVQPSLPRFVRPGDSFTAGGMGRVVEGDGGPGYFEVQTEGLELSNQGKTEVTWEKGAPRRIYVPMKLDELAEPGQNVKVRIGVVRNADHSRDAFEVKLPVKEDVSRVFTQTIVRGDSAKKLKLLNLVKKARTSGFQQSLLLSSREEPIAVFAALDYLANYPYDCAEQRISQLLPALAMNKIQNMMEGIGSTPREKMIGQLAQTLKYLELCQNEQGLFGYWPGTKGYVHLTAYAVEFLLKVRDSGYEFDGAMLTNGLRALKEALRSDYSHFITESRFYERTAALSALAAAGEFDQSYATEFAARAVQSDLMTEAKICKVFWNMGLAETEEAGIMLQDLEKSLIIAKDGNKEIYKGLQYRSQSWGGLIHSDEISTMAGVAAALHRANPENPKTNILMEKLTSMAGHDGWGSTQTNAVVLQTLNDAMNSESEEDTIRAALKWNGKEANWNTENSTLLVWHTQQPGKGSLQWNQTAPKHWIALQKASYYPSETGAEIRAESHGFVVQRELLRYQDDQTAPEKFPLADHPTLIFEVGDLIEEHIQLVNPEPGYYIALTIPLAAGFEPLNPHLATAPPEAQPAGRFTRNPSYAKYEDDSVTFFFDELDKGTYHFYFRVKAQFEGSFTQPAAFAENMYRQSVRGNSNAARINIHPNNPE